MPNHFAIRSDVIENPAADLGPLHRLREGDELAVFERRNGEVLFTGTTSVLASVSETKDGYKPPVFADPLPFKSNRPLAVLGGSLRRVYRFLEPERHFRRKVIWLEPDDFDVIRTGALNVERSTFRYLFSALPFQIQADFVSRYFNPESMTEDGEVRDYSRLAESLVEYLQTEVVSPINTMRDSAETFKRLQGIENLPPLRDLVISDDTGEQTLPLGQLITRIAITADNPILYDDRERSLLVEARKQLASDNPLRHGTSDSPSVEEEVVAYLQDRKWTEKIF